MRLPQTEGERSNAPVDFSPSKDRRPGANLLVLMVGMCSRKEQERHYRFCGDGRFRSEKGRRNVQR